ncbi:5285_t:CDS:2, partial [Cetraspora pellucida]
SKFGIGFFAEDNYKDELSLFFENIAKCNSLMEYENESVTESFFIEDNHEDELPVFLENIAEYNLLVEQNNNFMIGRESIIDLAQHSEVIKNDEIYTEDSQNSDIELENVTHISVAISNQVIDSTQQHQRPSRKIGCSWHINLTNPKASLVIGITSIVEQHNHFMIPDISLYAPKYHRLLEDIIEQIIFYITKGNIGSKQIYPLLVASFPDCIIYKQDLYNAIQKFKSSLTKRQGDA